MHVVARPGAGGAFPPAAPTNPVHWHAMGPPLGLRQLRMLRTGAVRALADEIRPDLVVERYYNFGGEGVRAARAARVPVVLEVNAPIVDYPGSPKHVVDRALI